MSTSATSVNSGIVAFDSAIRRATTCCVRVSSTTDTSPFVVPVSATFGSDVPGEAAADAAAGSASGSFSFFAGFSSFFAPPSLERRLLDVGLHDPPAGARPLDRREVDALLLGQAPRDRRGLDPLAVAGAVGVRLRLGLLLVLLLRLRLALRLGVLLLVLLGLGLVLLGRLGSASSSSEGSASGSSSSSSSSSSVVGLRGRPVRRALRRRLLADRRDDLADRERVALARDGVERALLVGLVGHRGLVRLDLGDLLALGDLVALGDEPLQDRALLHRVGQAGHRDLGQRGPPTCRGRWPGRLR